MNTGQFVQKTLDVFGWSVLSKLGRRIGTDRLTAYDENQDALADIRGRFAAFFKADDYRGALLRAQSVLTSLHRWPPALDCLNLNDMIAQGFLSDADRCSIYATRRPFRIMQGFERSVERGIACRLDALIDGKVAVEKMANGVTRDEMADLARSFRDSGCPTFENDDGAFVQLIKIRTRAIPVDVVERRIQRQNERP